jgi:hypothetical protein
MERLSGGLGIACSTVAITVIPSSKCMCMICCSGRSQRARSCASEPEIHVRIRIAEGDRQIPERQGQGEQDGASLWLWFWLWIWLWLPIPWLPIPKHERERVISVQSSFAPHNSLAPRLVCCQLSRLSKLLALHCSNFSRTAPELPRSHSMIAIAAGYLISRRPRVLDHRLNSVL